LLCGAPGTGGLGLFDRPLRIGGSGGDDYGEGNKTFHRESRVTVIDDFGAARPQAGRGI